MDEDVQAPLLLFGRNEPAGVQLGYNPVQAQLFLQLGQTIDQTCRGTERDLGLQDLVVSEIGEPFGLGLAALGGSGAGPSHRGPSELSLAIEIVPDALAGFPPRPPSPSSRRRWVCGDTHWLCRSDPPRARPCGMPRDMSSARGYP